MAIHIGYQLAAACTGGPTPGAKALMSWWLGAYGHEGGTNLGIYNCRTVPGASTTSLHGEGRAADFGINPHGAKYGDEVAELLRTRSKELGVQCVIWRRRIWSGSYPDKGWRAYTGTNPHLDHVHVELSWDAARTLTAAKVAAVLGVTVARSSSVTRTTIRRGSTGDAVKLIQRFLGVVPVSDPGYGTFGPATEAAVRRYQTIRGLPADGVVGPKTWAETGL